MSLVQAVAQDLILPCCILHHRHGSSDDTDASERTKIQYGTSYVYPIVSMGSHVSAVPNHQLYRTTPIETRANVAYFGTFGYELDLNLLSDAEMESVKKQIAFMKEYRELIQGGRRFLPSVESV